MEVTCEMCGKHIYIPRPAMYIYRRRKRSGGKLLWLCGWNCTVAFDQKHPRR